jgi:hypothetical protein
MTLRTRGLDIKAGAMRNAADIECKRRPVPNRGRTHCIGTGAAVLSGVR